MGLLVCRPGAVAGDDGFDRHASRGPSSACAAMLHEPFGLRELAALTVALGGLALALRAQ
jgi:hypothetical protein